MLILDLQNKESANVLLEPQYDLKLPFKTIKKE